MNKRWKTRISKLLLLVLVLGAFSGLGVGGHDSVSAAGNTYYVSPTGSDTNPGTEALPWKTFAKAAASLVVGDTAIFEDGTYSETAVAAFPTNGTAKSPITFKARNPHQAVLNYAGLNGSSKIKMNDRFYIVIQDFEITQDVKGASSADMFIELNNSSDSRIVGNILHNSYGPIIKVSKGSNVTVEQNHLYDGSTQGIFISNTASTVVNNNEINEVKSSAIMTAVGARSSQIYNNYVHTTSPMSYGIILGGNSAAIAAYDPSGFEAYNAVAWNNRIISEVPGVIDVGVSFTGSKDSAFYNNIVAGAKYNVKFMNGGGTNKGWLPAPTNPTYKNNIFVDTQVSERFFLNQPLNLVNDYNLYHNSPNPTVEPNGVYADPRFVDPLSNWNLHSDSPAIDVGTAVAFTGFLGETIDLSFDYNGTERIGLWDLGIYSKEQAPDNVFFVSPTGSDTNPGTETEPWKTFAKAAASLTAGDIAIFEDGTYVETTSTTFPIKGTAGAPITFKARNPHQAVLNYSGLSGTGKIKLYDKQYIVIQDFEITQDVRGTASADMFIDMKNSSNTTIIGNILHNSYGPVIKVAKGSNVTLEQNHIYDGTTQGIFLDNTASTVIKNNEINEVKSSGVLTSAGSRNTQISNNYIHTASAMSYGIILGGNTAAAAAYDPTGYEAFNAVAWNNKIISEVPGMIESAVSFTGSKDSSFFNNIVAGARYGVKFMNGGGANKGWLPVPTNSTYKNNIFVDLQNGAQFVLNQPLNVINDYNLYHNTANAPVEPNGVYADPLFVDPLSNWHLQTDSPAVDTGAAIAFNGFSGEVIDLSLDFDGVERVAPWDLGIYSVFIPKNPVTEGPILLSDDFENGASLWTMDYGNLGIVEETLGGNKVFTQPDASGESLQAKALAGSTEWQSYAIDLKVNFNDYYHKSTSLVLYARQLDNDNFYILDMRPNPESGYIGLKKKVDGFVIPLQEKLRWVPTEGWHNLTFIVNGTKLQVYIDGVLEVSGQDAKLTHGAIGAAIYRGDILIDDVVVTEIDAATAPGGSTQPKPEPGGTYYVSPTGSDDNPGTEQQPWKTAAKAAFSAQRGDTIIFEDGEYPETQVTFFEESGTESEPIVFKARNKHQAKIIYQNMPTTKLYIHGQSYITIQDLEITQNQRGVDTNDILVRVIKGSHHVKIIGNKVHNAFEDGIKGNLLTDYLVEGNIIYDITHEGVDFVNAWDSTIRNNEVYNVARIGVMVKGGSEDIQIYNNYIHSGNIELDHGITIGGSTAWDSTADYSVEGYEIYNSVAYNNVILSDVPGLIKNGITFFGSKDSAAYNNIVSGAQNNIMFQVPNNSVKGWEANPQNVNAVFKNNIITNATMNAVKFIDQPINLVHDYNLYDKNATTATEQNGVLGNPTIADLKNGNWHLSYGSAAIGAGTAIPGFTFRDGSSIDVSKDYDGIERGSVWDMGIYKYSPVINPNPTVHIIGASSTANHPASIAPLTGWGMPFKDMFNDQVTVHNYAISGFSSKNFYDLGKFTPVEEAMEPGDYLFIQFGHNDRNPDPSRYTDPYTTYKEYLAKYVLSARAYGAIPVLVSSSNEHRYNEDGTLKMTLGEYPNAMKQLAEELNVPFIDYNAISKILFEDLGPELTQELFLYLEPGEHVNYPDGKQDDTHFQLLGGTLFAVEVLKGVQELGLPLADFIDYAPIALPVTTANVAGEQGADGWYAIDATLTLSAYSDVRSAVAYTEYNLLVVEDVYGVTVPSTNGYVKYTSPIVLTGGVYDLTYRTKDFFGNVEADQTIRIMVNPDNTAPVTVATINSDAMIGSNGWYTSDVTLSLSATDDLSGVLSTEYQVNGGGWITYSGSIPAFSDGVYTFEYRSTDTAGNIEATKSMELKIDTTAPELTVELDPSVIWPANHKMVPINVTLNPIDAGSGVASVVLTSITSNEPDMGADDIQGADYGTMDTSFSLRAERLGNGTGRIYTIVYTITDNAGNQYAVSGTVTVPHNQ